MLIEQAENHLFLCGYFQSHLWLVGAREGQEDGTRDCKRTLAAITKLWDCLLLTLTRHTPCVKKCEDEHYISLSF